MKRQRTVIDRSQRTKRLRPKTARKRALKPVHIFLWKWMWERQQILPGEQYYESQLAAAKRFGVDQSTVSRQLAVLIENEAIIVVKPSQRGDDGFWTSKVIKVTEPPANPLAKMHTNELVEKTGVSSTCKNASPNAVHSPLLPTKETYTDCNSSTTVDDDYVSDAKMHVDEVTENKASRPLAKMHTERVSLADELVAAKKYLADLEHHVAQHGISGWEETLRRQRAKVRELEREYNGRTQ